MPRDPMKVQKLGEGTRDEAWVEGVANCGDAVETWKEIDLGSHSIDTFFR